MTPSPFLAPAVVAEASFQNAWLTAARELVKNREPLRNLMVQIQDPAAFDDVFHERFTTLAMRAGLLTPKQVAYTIFPHRLYSHAGSGAKLYDAYNRPGGMFERVRTSWGTYFHRMTAYQLLGSTPDSGLGPGFTQAA